VRHRLGTCEKPVQGVLAWLRDIALAREESGKGYLLVRVRDMTMDPQQGSGEAIAGEERVALRVDAFGECLSRVARLGTVLRDRPARRRKREAPWVGGASVNTAYALSYAMH